MATSKQRREAERRRLQRQAARRQARRQARRRTNLIVSIVGVVVVIAGVIGLLVATSGDDDSNSPAASVAPSGSAAGYPCTWVKGGTAAKPASEPSTITPPRTGTTNVTVRTTRGTMNFALDRAAAPCAVASFVSLVQQKYFDSTPCHRLTTGPSLYVLQCGDPTGKGDGGPGYSFADELTGKEKYTKGVLAMANSGADTNGSQFFIVYKNSTLTPDYTVFGRVTSGLDVVTTVAAKGVAAGSGSGADGKPAVSISLSSLAVAK